MQPPNVYHTTDPEKLLALKRLEADTLRDIVRSIYDHTQDLSKTFKVVKNGVVTQLKIKKLFFFYETDFNWFEGIRHGWREALSVEARAEMLGIHTTVKIEADTFPNLFEYGVEYVLPIKVSYVTRAYFLVAEFADSEEETHNDLIFLETVGHILFSAIENRSLVREKANQAMLEKELSLAETIQKQLLISDFSRFPSLDVHASNLAHDRIGGDFYDIVKKGERATFICIADVSGKGISAALLMSNLQASFRTLCAQYDDICLIVSELNRILYQITEGNRFLTFFLIKVDHFQKMCSYINAGHCYPLLYQDGQMRWLESQCLILGIMPTLMPKFETFNFNEYDNLFMFTDGLVEQPNKIDDMFGVEKVAEEMELVVHRPSKHIIEHFTTSFHNFADGTARTDDITMLNVKFL
ncbi:MAG: PP2C family protein-serine/threonine phosphatase [Bacteroidia bacterium]